MKITLRHSKEQGIAIIVVMVAIFVLSALTAEFAARMKVETRLSMYSNNDTEMEWLARSGIEFARYAAGEQLLVPNEPYDSMDQVWAGGPGGTNDGPLTGIQLPYTQQMGHGKWTLYPLVDTERKYNINLALNNEAVLQQALILVGADASQNSTIIASIQDWLDRDDETHSSGAETEFYQSLSPPYVAKNGPIDDISELLLIKGVTPDVYWGPSYSNHLYSAKPNQTGFSTLSSMPAAAPVGLVDIFTPISNGKINLNTASNAVLQMIPGIDQNMADHIIQMRSEAPIGEHGAGDLVNIGLSPVATQSLSQFCDVRSATYEVHVDVEVGLTRRRYFALIRRNNPKDVQILNMSWE
jgi:general secretion pathway protein K